MFELAVDHSEALAALGRDPALRYRYVKLGEWAAGRATEVLGAFPGREFLYHHNSPLHGPKADPAPAIAALLAWQQRTHSPWLSAHLDYYADDVYRAFFSQGTPLPPLTAEEGLALLCRAVAEISARLPVPLLLENVDPLVPPEVCAAPRPEFIRRVLDSTGCGLLLDTAHARVSAAALGIDVHDYLEQLPLERAVELHVSGPRWREGRLADVHEALLEEDYDLLRWVLARARPSVVTLEYGRDPALLREQLLRLNEMKGPDEPGSSEEPGSSGPGSSGPGSSGPS